MAESIEFGVRVSERALCAPTRIQRIAHDLRIWRSVDVDIRLLFFRRGAAIRWIHHRRISLLLF